MKLLLVLVIMHLVADFVLQSDRLSKDKNDYYQENKRLITPKNPLLKHGILVLLIMQMLHLMYSPWYLIGLLSIIITVVHILIDHIKLRYFKNSMKFFILDQLTHLLVLYGISSLFPIKYTQKYLYILGNYRSLSNQSDFKIPDFTESQLMAVVLFITFSFVFGYIISFILDQYGARVQSEDDKQENVTRTKGVLLDLETEANSEIATANEPAQKMMSEGTKRIGIKIGIIERMLVIIFVACGQYAALGLILAGKSLARFEDLKDKVFAEYYLLGTLLSFLFGVTGGLLIHTL